MVHPGKRVESYIMPISGVPKLNRVVSVHRKSLDDAVRRIDSRVDILEARQNASPQQICPSSQHGLARATIQEHTAGSYCLWLCKSRMEQVAEGENR